MATKRTPLRRQMRWQITPAALQIWRLILEIQAQPRNSRGEETEENRVALRDAMAELAHVVGFSKFTVGIELTVGIGDKPPDWIINNSVQMQRWQEAKEIHNALNSALLAATAAQVPAPTARRRAKTPPSIQRGSVSAPEGELPEPEPS